MRFLGQVLVLNDASPIEEFERHICLSCVHAHTVNKMANVVTASARKRKMSLSWSLLQIDDTGCACAGV